MTWSAFDEDLRFCRSCGDYVRYLRSPDRCYCVECGGEAQLMSDAEMRELRREARARPGQGSPWRLDDDGGIRAAGS